MTYWMFTLLAVFSMSTQLFADQAAFPNDFESNFHQAAFNSFGHQQASPLLVMFTKTDQPDGMYWLSIPSLNPDGDELPDEYLMGADQDSHGFVRRDLTDWFDHRSADALSALSVCSLKELSQAKGWCILVVNCQADEHRPETQPTNPPPGSGGSGNGGNGSGG